VYVIIATCTANTSVSITLAWTSPYALMNFALCTDRKQTYSLQISSKLHLFEPILAEKRCDVYSNILTWPAYTLPSVILAWIPLNARVNYVQFLVLTEMYNL